MLKKAGKIFLIFIFHLYENYPLYNSKTNEFFFLLLTKYFNGQHVYLHIYVIAFNLFFSYNLHLLITFSEFTIIINTFFSNRDGTIFEYLLCYCVKLEINNFLIISKR